MKFQSALLLGLLPWLWTSCDIGSVGPQNIGIRYPNADFAMTSDRTSPAGVSFLNLSTNADIFVWNFGSVGQSSAQHPYFTFGEPGDYDIRLIARSSSLSNYADTVVYSITVIPGTVFLFSVRLDEIPFTDSSGTAWDADSGPDFLYELTYAGAVLNSGTIHSDVTVDSLPSVWQVFPEYAMDYDDHFTLSFYDADGGMNILVDSVKFDIDILGDSLGFNNPLEFSNTSQSLRVAFGLNWD